MANAELQRELAGYLEREKLSMERAGKRFGYSATTLSRYLAGEFAGNLARLEHCLRDGLRHQGARKSRDAVLFPTHVASQIESYCVRLQNHGWMGLVHGDAGIGKTCGASKVIAEDLAAIFITILSYRKDRAGLTELLWQQIGSGEPHMQLTAKLNFIEEKLRGSGRLLIVDQAHLLNRPGRQYFCDLHDAIGLPILFIGNIELLSNWKEQAQQFSRLRLIEKVTMESVLSEERYRKLGVAQIARDMLAMHAPGESHGELFPEAMRILRDGEGRVRALETALKMLPEFKKETVSWTEAFQAAERRQARCYKTTYQRDAGPNL